MKAFFLKVKNGAKKFFLSDFFVGGLSATVIFLCVLIFSNMKHETELLNIQRDSRTQLKTQEQFYIKKINISEKELYFREKILTSQKEMIDRASALIYKYQKIIQDLSRQLEEFKTPFDINRIT